jgi:hypothetical protein
MKILGQFSGFGKDPNNWIPDQVLALFFIDFQDANKKYANRKEYLYFEVTTSIGPSGMLFSSKNRLA